PVKSPSHQVSHSEGRSAQRAECARHRLKFPIVALTIVQTSATHTNLNTSRARSSEARNPKAFSAAAAHTAERVVPIAIAPAAAAGMGVRKLARNAPRKMPGHAR